MVIYWISRTRRPSTDEVREAIEEVKTGVEDIRKKVGDTDA